MRHIQNGCRLDWNPAICPGISRLVVNNLLLFQGFFKSPSVKDVAGTFNGTVSHNFVAENHRVIFELTLKRLKRKLLCFNSKYFRSVPFKTYIEMAMVHPLFKSHVTFWTKISFLEFNFKIKFLCHFYIILCFEDSEEGRYFWAQGRLDRNLAREWHNSGEMEEVNSP